MIRLQAIFIFIFAAITLPVLLSLQSAEDDQSADITPSETNISKTIDTQKQIESHQWPANGSFILIHKDF